MFDCWFARKSKEGVRKKGHCLSYRLEHYMEFGNTSEEEAPHARPRNTDLSKSMQMQIVVMPQGKENDGSLQRGLVTAIAKRFGMAHCTVHCLWKRVACMHPTGIINSPEFNSRKIIPGGHLFILWSLLMKVSRTCH